jgi:hypothetical protein
VTTTSCRLSIFLSGIPALRRRNNRVRSNALGRVPDMARVIHPQAC